MDIKKLYADVCVLVGEVPLYSFFTYCDMCARSIIAHYGEKYALGEGEYVCAASFSDSFALDDAFYTAVLLYVAGKESGNVELISKSESEAESAYRGLWRKKAKGKRIMGVKW